MYKKDKNLATTIYAVLTVIGTVNAVRYLKKKKIHKGVFCGFLAAASALITTGLFLSKEGKTTDLPPLDEDDEEDFEFYDNDL